MILVQISEPVHVIQSIKSIVLICLFIDVQNDSATV